MKKLTILFLLVIACACDEPDAGSGGIAGAEGAGNLNDQVLENYMKAYLGLKESSTETLRMLNEKGREMQSEAADNIIQNAGLSSFAEFVQLNAYIGELYTHLQIVAAAGEFGKMEENSNNQFDEAINEWQKQLDDPDIPESAKAQIRESIAAMENGKAQMQNTFAQNAEKIEKRKKDIKKLTDKSYNQSDLNVVQKYEDDLFDAYKSFPSPNEYKLDQM